MIQACAAPSTEPARTPWQPRNANGGYAAQDLGNGLTSLSFVGNPWTPRSVVQCLAHRRAAELCSERHVFTGDPWASDLDLGGSVVEREGRPPPRATRRRCSRTTRHRVHPHRPVPSLN
jgi:hypothetical protein